MSSVQDGGDESGKKPEPSKKRGRKKTKPEDVTPTTPALNPQDIKIYNLEDFLSTVLGGLVVPENTKLGIPPNASNEHLFRETQEDDYDRYVSDANKKDYEVLGNVLSEYMDSYLILGFKPNGNSVALRRTGSVKDRDALTALINRYVMGNIEF